MEETMKKGKKIAMIVIGILAVVAVAAAIIVVMTMKRAEKSIDGLDFSAFQTTDIEGNTITQDIFQDYDVTMVNIWATWCEPCRKEMPDIQAASEQLPENANIISICTDAQENEELAAEIAEKAGIQFEVLMAKDKLEGQVKAITSLPTTVFVDSKGNLIGEPIVGVRGGVDVTAFYLDEINGLLAQ